MNERLKFSSPPEFQHSFLVVSWSGDAGGLGMEVTDYLTRKLGGRSFCEIEPVDFFSLGTVAIENDLVQFPESTFYFCPGYDLVVFKSPPPDFEWYKFLNLILDVAQHYCQGKELYSVSGMVSLAAHTAPRVLMNTFNSSEIKLTLRDYDLSGDWDYETPPGGQRPTINSYLLWAAKKRNIPAVGLWVPIPFYLMGVGDPRAQKKVRHPMLNTRIQQ